MPDPTGLSVTISTPGFLTNDGALVNGAQHDNLRDRLIDGFTRGVAGDAESGLCLPSLARGARPSIPPTVDNTVIDFDTTTRLSVDRLCELVDRVGFPLLERSRYRYTWRLGLDTGMAASTARVELADDNGLRQLSGQDALIPAGGTFANLVAVQRAHNRAMKADDRHDPPPSLPYGS